MSENYKYVKNSRERLKKEQYMLWEINVKFVDILNVIQL